MTAGQLADLERELYEAALANIEKSISPPPVSQAGEYASSSTKAYAEAARALVQSLATLTAMHSGGGGYRR